jgi:branched-chain amino acid transport system ATP-binding protein
MLLLDEPVSGMNPPETASFMRLLAQIREHDVTVLLVEHDMRMVMGVSDRVVALNQGKIIAEGPPRRTRRSSASGRRMTMSRALTSMPGVQ